MSTIPLSTCFIIDFQTRRDFERECVKRECDTLLREMLLNKVITQKVSTTPEKRVFGDGLNSSVIHANKATGFSTPFTIDTSNSIAHLSTVSCFDNIIPTDAHSPNSFPKLDVATQDVIRHLLFERDSLRHRILEEQNHMSMLSANLTQSRVAAGIEKKSTEEALSALRASLFDIRCERHKNAELRDKTRSPSKCLAKKGASHAVADFLPEKKPLPTLSPNSNEVPLQPKLKILSPALLDMTNQPLSLSAPLPPAFTYIPDDPFTLSTTSSEDTCKNPFSGTLSTPENSTDVISVNCCVLQPESLLDANQKTALDFQTSIIPPEGINAALLQSPIGRYIRPPMSLEDMKKCIRCLLGKDKSLKTGNRARAFLGIPWSQIVSFDPDTLLQRGVTGIKPGSTGMASRLRMMTIIESALANQNHDNIPEEVWERPTYFCERCQQLYPITVSSNIPVQTIEKYEAIRAKFAPPPTMAGPPSSQGDAIQKKSRRKTRGSRSEPLSVVRFPSRI